MKADCDGETVPIIITLFCASLGLLPEAARLARPRAEFESGGLNPTPSRGLTPTPSRENDIIYSPLRVGAGVRKKVELTPQF